MSGGFVSRCHESLLDKAQEINLLLTEGDVVDLWKLRELALTEGGLVDDEIRKRAWPKLVGAVGYTDDATLMPTTPITNQSSFTASLREPYEVPILSPEEKEEEAEDDQYGVIQASTTDGNKAVLVRSLDAEQIGRDIARCTWHLLSGSQRAKSRTMKYKDRRKVSALIRKKQNRLGNLVNLVLVRSYKSASSKDDRLRYYQGYHDVACIFLSALGGGTTTAADLDDDRTMDDLTRAASASGLELPARVLLQVSHFHFRDAMRANFNQLTAAVRLTLFPLIAAFDSEVHSFLRYDSDMEPFFAISWIITWFSHEIKNTMLVKRLFDVFLVSHPLMPIYISVAMVLHPINRLELLAAEPDFATVHNLLSHLPQNSCYAAASSVGGFIEGTSTLLSGGGEGGFDDETASYQSDEFMMLGDDAGSVVTSVSSVDQYPGRLARVPFQDLIDMAISFMRRIPPRKLMPLAHKYFRNEDIQPLLAISSSIALLQPPPSWGLASTAPTDYVLHQRARTRRGMRRSSRRSRRSRSRQRRRRSGSGNSFCSNDMMMMMDDESTPSLMDDTAPDDHDRGRNTDGIRRRKRTASRREPRGRSTERRRSFDLDDADDLADDNSIILSDHSQAPMADNNNTGAMNKTDPSGGEPVIEQSLAAIIAAGIGPDGEEEDRLKKRRRSIIFWGGCSVAVAILAISIAALIRSGVLKVPSFSVNTLLTTNGSGGGGGGNSRTVDVSSSCVGTESTSTCSSSSMESATTTTKTSSMEANRAQYGPNIEHTTTASTSSLLDNVTNTTTGSSSTHSSLSPSSSKATMTTTTDSTNVQHESSSNNNNNNNGPFKKWIHSVVHSAQLGLSYEKDDKKEL